jgi:hypothetical protein
MLWQRSCAIYQNSHLFILFIILFCSGLKQIHLLTSTQGAYMLRVELEDRDGRTGYAEYQRFLVEGPDEQYRLNVGGYTGTIGKESIQRVCG